jgi:hypothetical protein
LGYGGKQAEDKLADYGYRPGPKKNILRERLLLLIETSANPLDLFLVLLISLVHPGHELPRQLPANKIVRPIEPGLRAAGEAGPADLQQDPAQGHGLAAGPHAALLQAARAIRARRVHAFGQGGRGACLFPGRHGYWAVYGEV